MSKRVTRATLSSCGAAGSGKVVLGRKCACRWEVRRSLGSRGAGRGHRALCSGSSSLSVPSFCKDVCRGSVLPALGERRGGKRVFHARAWLQDLEDLSYIAQNPQSSSWQGHQLGSRVAALSGMNVPSEYLAKLRLEWDFAI